MDTLSADPRIHSVAISKEDAAALSRRPRVYRGDRRVLDIGQAQTEPRKRPLHEGTTWGASRGTAPGAATARRRPLQAEAIAVRLGTLTHPSRESSEPGAALGAVWRARRRRGRLRGRGRPLVSGARHRNGRAVTAVGRGGSDHFRERRHCRRLSDLNSVGAAQRTCASIRDEACDTEATRHIRPGGP